MNSRRHFFEQAGLGLMSTLIIPLKSFSESDSDFDGIVVNEEEGEAIQMRDGTAIVKIKVAKNQGVRSVSFLSESFRPGDALPVHKHLNEDELIFIHTGYTLDDNT